MKILLVCPKYKFEGYAPTGLASIAAYAKMLGHQVRVVDLNKSKIKSDKYDIIGITGMSWWKREIIKLTQKFDNTIVGGTWATLYPQRIMEKSRAKYICVGEGEEIFRDFLEKFPDVNDVKGLWIREQNGTIKNPSRKPIENLDSILMPAYEVIEGINKYYTRVPIITSRGCPFKCIFCSHHLIQGYKWRAKSPEKVLEEIEYLVSLGVKHITFGDENVSLVPERFERICELIISKKIKATFDAIQGLRADRITPKLLELMKKAHFTEIIIAPESGSQRVLDKIIHKNLDLSCVEPVITKCKELNLVCSAFFVIGFPWETMVDIQETIEYADYLRSKGLHSAYMGNAIPLPETELYHKAKQEGCLRWDGEELENHLDYLDYPRSIHCLTSPYWKPEDIIRICRNEERKNLSRIYKKYGLMTIARKFFRSPICSARKALRFLRL